MKENNNNIVLTESVRVINRADDDDDAVLSSVSHALQKKQENLVGSPSIALNIIHCWLFVVRHSFCFACFKVQRVHSSLDQESSGFSYYFHSGQSSSRSLH